MRKKFKALLKIIWIYQKNLLKVNIKCTKNIVQSQIKKKLF